MEQAIAIIQWHLEETRRLLAPFPQETNYEDAEKLMKWILSKRHVKQPQELFNNLGH